MKTVSCIVSSLFSSRGIQHNSTGISSRGFQHNSVAVSSRIFQHNIAGISSRGFLTKSVGPLAAVALTLASCSSRQTPAQTMPDNFDQFADTAKVAYMMDVVSPDSVARFICDAALGKSKVAAITAFPEASAYAYQHYADSSLIAFSQELDYYSANLPLADKMKIYSMAGQTDPQRLGYELGLEYVGYIRDNKANVEEVKKEIAALKSACGEDSLTYIRFLKGFKTVLQADRGKDLPEEIYNVFINY